MRQFNAVLAIAQRDFAELLRDPARLVSSLIFPLIFITVLGGSLQASFGDNTDFDLLTFIFTGVLAQTLFQASASGVISVIADREKDFSQEIFVTPIARRSIIFGKALGETWVALPQGFALVVVSFVLGVGMTVPRAIALLPVALVSSMLGAAFGVLVLSNLRSQRSANQVFPFVLLPQFFLAGVFNPINDLPPSLAFFSALAPMRYAVDLMRATYYSGRQEYDQVVLLHPVTNLIIIGAMFLVFLAIGTALFVRKERNR